MPADLYRHVVIRFIATLLALLVQRNEIAAFTLSSTKAFCTRHQKAISKLCVSTITIDSVESASRILSDWDQYCNPDATSKLDTIDASEMLRPMLPEAIRYLSVRANEERARDSLQGRVMLGVCATSAEQGITALKSWVNALSIPRGLLHGMDKDGVPLEIEGGVYIKYNTGGSLTFADIRKSGIGFDAIWKPGDAMLELYDGTYRGVYFQVELSDGEFRQFLLPLDTFDDIPS
jgi:hypothetical protein